MGEAAAVRVAIDLVHVPSRVRSLRTEPLPDGVLTVLRIASGEKDAEIAVAEMLDRPRALVREACAFFVEQILLAPDADSYRVLGASRDATAADLRRNMALLLKWLHPDLNHTGLRSALAHRVTEAWETIKTPERRAVYDRERPPRGPRKSKQRRRRAKPAWRAPRLQQLRGGWTPPPRGLVHRALALFWPRARP
jgi:DnaJ domain